MTAREPVSEERIDIYDLDVIPWRRARAALEGAVEVRTTHVLSTVGADGNPHAVPFGAVWLDDTFFFTAGERTRKPATWRTIRAAWSPSRCQRSISWSKVRPPG